MYVITRLCWSTQRLQSWRGKDIFASVAAVFDLTVGGMPVLPHTWQYALFTAENQIWIAWLPLWRQLPLPVQALPGIGAPVVSAGQYDGTKYRPSADRPRDRAGAVSIRLDIPLDCAYLPFVLFTPVLLRIGESRRSLLVLHPIRGLLPCLWDCNTSIWR